MTESTDVLTKSLSTNAAQYLVTSYFMADVIAAMPDPMKYLNLLRGRIVGSLDGVGDHGVARVLRDELERCLSNLSTEVVQRAANINGPPTGNVVPMARPSC